MLCDARDILTNFVFRFQINYMKDFTTFLIVIQLDIQQK